MEESHLSIIQYANSCWNAAWQEGVKTVFASRDPVRDFDWFVYADAPPKCQVYTIE